MTQAGIEHNYGLLKPRHRSKQLQECTINVALRVMLRIHSQSFYLFVFYVWVSFYHSPAQCNSVVSLFGLPEFLGTTLDVAPRSSLRKLHFLSRFPQFLSTKSNSVPTQCKSLHQDAVRWNTVYSRRAHHVDWTWLAGHQKGLTNEVPLGDTWSLCWLLMAFLDEEHRWQKEVQRVIIHRGCCIKSHWLQGHSQLLLAAFWLRHTYSIDDNFYQKKWIHISKKLRNMAHQKFYVSYSRTCIKRM